MEREFSLIGGAISVKAVLENDSRDIFKIYISEKKLSDRNIRYIIAKAKEKQISVEAVSADFFDKEIFGKTCGGIGAEVSDRKFVSEDSLFSPEKPFIAIIEGVEDPYNFGAALRSLYAAGATGLLLPKRNWTSAAATVIKASAGASEMIDIAICDDFEPFLTKAKERGFEIIAGDRKDAVNLFKTDLSMPLILAIGGEKRGLSKKISAFVTKNVYIPYGNDFRNSLGTAGATAVFAFEILRQRSGK